MKPFTLEQQMARFGIPETEQGPFVAALREATQKKLDSGMVMQSAGMMADGFYSLPYEEQAKARLAFDWALERRHSYRTEVIDPMWGWRTDTRTMKRRPYVRWHRIPAWLGDRFREAAMKYRVWRDRTISNPYL